MHFVITNHRNFAKSDRSQFYVGSEGRGREGCCLIHIHTLVYIIYQRSSKEKSQQNKRLNLETRHAKPPKVIKSKNDRKMIKQNNA